MKFKILLSIAAIVAATGNLHAQYAADALRFSQTTYGSTARFKALSGTQIGVGGDLSSLGGNPAGIGLFTRSELSITPGFNSFNTNSVYLNGTNTSSKDNLNLAHAGVVWHRPTYKKAGSDLNSGFISSNFGIGYNRTNDLGNSILFSGINPASSIGDSFAGLANDFTNPTNLPDGSLESMAYEDYLLDYDKKFIPVTRFNNNQSRSDIRTGSQSELNFVFGINQSNKFYIGASINLTSLNYMSGVEYKELGIADIKFNNTFKAYNYDLAYRQDQTTKGSGFNGKLGMIFRPVEMVRIGVTFETPTYYSIEDSYSEVLNTKYSPNLPTPPLGNSPSVYDFNYQLRTPSKLSGGASYFFGNQGFISADIDYVDYTKINFSSSDNGDATTISSNNREVFNNYKSAINYRLGAEYKIDRVMLRAGYAIQGSPYQDVNYDLSTYSGGLGYRFDRMYVDLSYQNVSYNTNMRPYPDNTGPTAMVDNSRSNVFFTIGTRF
ncbi:MAG TPA: outer membrane protein transport protein [Sphingobacteriaceae bacterium]|nr:outer membrane protein transport protein [Sphingobacteriaceae bacterium]